MYRLKQLVRPILPRFGMAFETDGVSHCTFKRTPPTPFVRFWSGFSHAVFEHIPAWRMFSYSLLQRLGSQLQLALTNHGLHVPFAGRLGETRQVVMAAQPNVHPRSKFNVCREILSASSW